MAFSCILTISEFSKWWSNQPAEVRNVCNVGLIDAVSAPIPGTEKCYPGFGCMSDRMWVEGTVVISTQASIPPPCPPK